MGWFKWIIPALVALSIVSDALDWVWHRWRFTISEGALWPTDCWLWWADIYRYQYGTMTLGEPIERIIVLCLPVYDWRVVPLGVDSRLRCCQRVIQWRKLLLPNVSASYRWHCRLFWIVLPDD